MAEYPSVKEHSAEDPEINKTKERRKRKVREVDSK